MRARLLPLVMLVVGTTACVGTLEAPNGRFGTMTANTFDNGGGFVMRPEAAFYDQTDLSYVPFQGDTCVITTYSPQNQVNGSLLTLNAGEFLVTRVSGRVDSLASLTGSSFRLYTPLRPQGIPFVPGDTLSLTVPGAPGGFPASVISIRTAEAFTHTPVAVPVENASLPIAWTPAPSGGSQMTFSLRYANANSGGALNEQIFCSFDDDGAASIAAIYLDGWRTALSDNRETRALRVRSREVTIDGRTRLNIISSFGRPLLSLNF